MQLKVILISFLVSFLTFAQDKTTDGLDIIQKTLAGISSNYHEEVLESFEYKTYTKGIVLTQNKTTLDLVATPNNFLFEETAQFNFSQKRPVQKRVLGSTLPGFKFPFYPIYARTFHSLSVYKNEYEILGKHFYGPLSKNAYKHYHFQLRETVINNDYPYHIIYFSPINNRDGSQLTGELFIDVKTYAVQKAIIRHSQNIEAEIIHHFRFHESENLWFPEKTEFQVTLNNAIEQVNLFGNRIPSGRLEQHNNKELITTFSIETLLFDVVINEIPSETKSQFDIKVNITDNHIDESFRSEFKLKDLTEEETSIVDSASKIITSGYIEKKIQRIDDFRMGFLELGFFDLDLKYLIKYNNYEGFRSGLGGMTNDKLSSHFNLGGYLVRGFKDETFKYQLSTSINLNKASGTIWGLSYTDDVNELGSHKFLTDSRSFSLFEPRLVNIIQFYAHKSWETFLQQTINPKISSEIQLSHSDISQILNYEFLNNNEFYSGYQLFQTKASLLWSPFGEFMQTPKGITEYQMGYPRFSAQITQSFKGPLNGNFNFSKIDVRTDYYIEHVNRSSTEVVLEGNFGLGDIPLTHMYHAYPNSPNKETILRRFSVAGTKSFETMYFGEFFSNRLATIHIKHQLKPFAVASWFKPELVLISRHAIGTDTNRENHQNISYNTLEKGYSESGMEINQLFFGFGVSLAYRYGAYHLPKFEDNISFKFTFNLKL